MSTPAKSIAVATVVVLVACGGRREEAKPVQRQTSADEILRISTTWSATLPEQGLLSPPSPISLYKNSRTSTITLSEAAAHETLVIEENLQLRDGQDVRCSTSVDHELAVRYGRRKGEAAVELSRPPLSVVRNCQGTHPDGAISEGPTTALFVLRADTLIAVEPPLEKRKYLPIAH